MRNLLMGIDIGTSACKVALFRPDGEVAARCGAKYPVYYPRPGWAEQNPEEWWQAVCGTVREALEKARVKPGEVSAVGVDGQSWSAIPVDSEGNVLCNTPIWMDTRAEGICEGLEKEMGGGRIFGVSGNPLQGAYTGPKVLWYKTFRPEVYEKTAYILQSNSFIVYKLTGEYSQDESQGYGWFCFNMKSKKWDIELCQEAGLNPGFLPQLYPCHQVVGVVTRQAAALTGLQEGTPVVAGGLDAACGTLGAGVIQPGQTQEQGGQAGGMSICLDTYTADKRLILSAHVVPGRWLLQGGTVGGGGVVRWLEQELGAKEKELALRNNTNPLLELDKAAEAVPAGSEGVVFLPYMSGERSPIWDAKAKGVFYGLDFSKTRGHLYRAGMEGVAFSLRHNLEAAESAGARAEVLRAVGGAANSPLWTQIKADVTGKPIVVPEADAATTLGAAILAGVGTGAYKSFEEAVSAAVTIKRAYEPDEKNRAVYDRGYGVYRALYEKIRDIPYVFPSHNVDG